MFDKFYMNFTAAVESAKSSLAATINQMIVPSSSAVVSFDVVDEIKRTMVTHFGMLTAYLCGFINATKKGRGEKNQTEIAKEVSDHETKLQKVEDYVVGL